MFPRFLFLRSFYKRKSSFTFMQKNILTSEKWRCNMQIGNILHKWRKSE